MGDQPGPPPNLDDLIAATDDHRGGGRRRQANHPLRSVSGSPVSPPTVASSTVKHFLGEDIGRGDITTRAVLPRDVRGRARILVRSAGVISGIDVARRCFASLGEVVWKAKRGDGDLVEAEEVAVELEGPLRCILPAERTALNLMGRLSGVSTTTALFVAAVAHTRSGIIDTRKTTPGLRELEKYAVRVGGGANHRFGLDDGILIKENHAVAVGGLSKAIRRARLRAPGRIPIQAEVRDLAEFEEAVEARPDSILLDNMAPDDVRRAVERTAGQLMLEASGGITLDNVRSYAETGVDLISVGALTHSAPAMNLSLIVDP